MLEVRRPLVARAAPERCRALLEPTLAILRDVRPQRRRTVDAELVEIPTREGEREVQADDSVPRAYRQSLQNLGAAEVSGELGRTIGGFGLGEPDLAVRANPRARPVDGDDLDLRKLHCDVQSAVQESGWTYLSEGFIQDLERAIGDGVTISSVLQEYGLNRSTYYSWLAIGEGRMTRWRDGTPISADMRTNCRRLYKRVLRAREAHLRTKRQALR